MRQVRSTIILWNYVGLFFSVFGLALFGTALLGDVNGFKIDITTMQPFEQVLIVFAAAYLVYAIWKTVFFTVTIIRFMKVRSDEELIANRFMLAVYSLTVGGFCTPWMLTKLPNVESNSTLNPKHEIAKVYTLNYAVGGAILIASLFAFAASLNVDLFAQGAQLTSSIILGVAGAAAAFGLIGGIFYWRKNSLEAYQKNPLMKFIAVVFLFIVTVELFLKIVSAILTLIQAVADMFRGEGSIFYRMIVWLNSMITIMYSIFLISICWATIKGIWSKQGVTMKEFSGLKNAEEKNHVTPSWKNS